MAFSTQDTMILYNGNAVDTTFAIPFEFTDDSSVKAQKYDITDPQAPVLIPMVEGTDYTVDGVNVVTTVPVGAAEQILIYRESDDDHPILYSGYQFPYATINKDLDTLYQLVQEARKAIEGVGLSLYEQASGAPAFDFEAVKDLLELDISQELSDLDSRLDTAEGSILLLQSETTTNSNDIATLQGQVGTLQSEVLALQSAVLALQGTVSGLPIASIQSDITTLQNEMDAVESDVADLQNDVQLINNIINTLTLKTVVEITTDTVHPALNGQVIVVKGGAVVDITLPSTPIAGDEIIVKRRGFTGDLTILPTNSLLLDGAAFKIISSLESSATIFYTGTEWIII